MRARRRRRYGEEKEEKGGKREREREHRGLVRSASPTAGVYEEEERCSWARHSEGMARRRGRAVGSFEVGRYRV